MFISNFDFEYKTFNLLNSKLLIRNFLYFRCYYLEDLVGLHFYPCLETMNS
jgi:hypothetical protein